MSESVQRRALVTPDEVGRLFGGENNPASLALLSGEHPLVVRRKPYYKELNFAGYHDPHPDHPEPPDVLDGKQNALRCKM